MYVKLFGQILDSSIWLEAGDTRLVWITLLAAMDRDGFARFAAVENLARRANVTLKACEKAVQKLESPDPNSSDPANEGKRIERVPGGWLVLNAAKYRELDKEINRREKTRERVAAWRKAQRESAGNEAVTPRNESETKSNAMHMHKHMHSLERAMKETKQDPNVTTVKSAKSADPTIGRIFDYWRSVTGHPTAKLTPKRERKVRDRLVQGYTEADIRAAIDGCKASAFHQGNNEQGKRYDDLELICRDGEHLEQFVSNEGGTNGGTIRRDAIRKESRSERIERETNELFAGRNLDPFDAAIPVISRIAGTGN